MAEPQVTVESMLPASTPAGQSPVAVSKGWKSQTHTHVQSLGRVAVLVGIVAFSALVPLMPTNDMKADLTLLSGLVLVLGLYFLWRGGALSSRSRLDLPLIVFILAASLATVLSPRSFLSFVPSRSRGDGLLIYVVYVLMGWAAARLRPDSAKLVLRGGLAGAIVIAAVAVGQFYGADPLRLLGFRAVDPGVFFGILPLPTADLPYHGWRSFGTLGNPIFLGGYTLLVLPVIIAFVLASDRRCARYILLTALAGTYAALLASASRAAFAGLVLSVGMLLVVPPRLPRPWKRLVLVAGVLAAVTALLTLTGPGEELMGRARGGVSSQDGSLRMKLFVWKNILPLIAQRPIFGWGFSNLAGRLPGIGSKEYFEIYGFALSGIDTAHNEILHIAFSTGLLGLAAYLWIWAVVLKALLAAVRHSGEHRAVAAGILAGLAGYFLWLQSAWSHIGPANVFWTLAGIAVALERSGKEAAASAVLTSQR